MQVYVLVLLIGTAQVPVSHYETLLQCESRLVTIQVSESLGEYTGLACVPKYFDKGWMASFLRRK